MFYKVFSFSFWLFWLFWVSGKNFPGAGPRTQATRTRGFLARNPKKPKKPKKQIKNIVKHKVFSMCFWRFLAFSNSKKAKKPTKMLKTLCFTRFLAFRFGFFGFFGFLARIFQGPAPGPRPPEPEDFLIGFSFVFFPAPESQTYRWECEAKLVPGFACTDFLVLVPDSWDSCMGKYMVLLALRGPPPGASLIVSWQLSIDNCQLTIVYWQ